LAAIHDKKIKKPELEQRSYMKAEIDQMTDEEKIELTKKMKEKHFQMFSRKRLN
jgi:hypothetical protein